MRRITLLVFPLLLFLTVDVEQASSAHQEDGSPGNGFQINAGLNDVWFNPATNGQGFFVTVFPDRQKMFLGWFTFDIQRPPADVTAQLGDPGHRWLTAFGDYSEGTAMLDVELTRGGVFNLGDPAPSSEPDGTITIDFLDCDHAELTYAITSTGVSGVVPIQRIANDNIPLCEALGKSISRPSAGCGSAGFGNETAAMIHGGITRKFRLHVPTGYEIGVPSPAVLYFHGWGGNENELIGNSAAISEADERGYILVAPRGLGAGSPDASYNSWTFSGSDTGLDGDGMNGAVPGDTTAICDPVITPDYSYASCALSKENSCSWTQCQADDVEFALALVEEIGANLCIDLNRVFATGGSNGGMFTWELGQNPASSSTFRAIAPLIGLPHRGYLGPQAKNGNLPVIVITGAQDQVVPPGVWDDPSFTTTSNDSDRFYYTGATAITRSWAEKHGCDTSVAAAPFNDGYEEPDCRTYCADDPGWPRVLDCRANMGHAYSYNWSWKLVLDFFDAHSSD